MGLDAIDLCQQHRRQAVDQAYAAVGAGAPVAVALLAEQSDQTFATVYAMLFLAFVFHERRQALAPLQQ